MRPPARPPEGYTPRRPEETDLHRLVSAWWPRFHERSEEAGGLPRFVVQTFERYLRCGVLAHGFVRVSCPTCRDDLLVAWSCRRRGLCPTCSGRRMADTAAHLVDRVLPDVPVRQWVLTLPFRLRARVAFDHKLAPPQLEHLSVEEYTKRHDAALRAKVTAAVEQRKAKGLRFLGLKMLAKTSHNRRPRRKEKAGRRNGIKPHLAASCSQLRIAAIEALQTFREEYRDARRRYLEGERTVEFPAGTYQLRLLHGVRVAPLKAA